MKKLPAQYLAWFLWAFAVGLALVILLVEIVLVPSVRELTLAELVANVLTFTAMATVGAVIASRRPENLIGWLVLFFPAIGATAEATEVYARYATHVNPGALPGGEIAWLLANSIWVMAYGLLPFMTLLFPSGTLLSPRWRWVAWGLVAAFGALIAADSFSPELDSGISSTVASPLAIASAAPILDAVYNMAGFTIAILWAAAGVSLVLRLARSSGDERQQMKWFAYTAAIVAVFMAAIIAVDLSGHVVPSPWEEYLVVGFILFLTLGMAMAILRYRLYDIDLVINRTLVYGTLTAVLGGVYVGSVIGLQATFRATTGQGGGELAIVISTLAIAALFMPLRRRIQVLIERRFYRRRYNAAQTLAAFSARMRDEVDVEKLTAELVGVVEQTMQPAHASLWLRTQEARR